MSKIRGGSASDRFVKQVFDVQDMTANAIRIKAPDGTEVWVGMSNLSFKSEKLIAGLLSLPCEVELEIRQWVLRRAGFNV